jgi:hypothetical protein
MQKVKKSLPNKKNGGSSNPMKMRSSSFDEEG